MEVEKTYSKADQARKAEELHCDCQQLKSELWFMDDELLFLDRLLNSYVFEPNTPNLFERLQDYIKRLKKARAKKIQVAQQLSQHEKNLGGMTECKDDACDQQFYEQHDVLKTQLLECVKDFQNLKSDIFNYAGGILKKRKPHSQT